MAAAISKDQSQRSKPLGEEFVEAKFCFIEIYHSTNYHPIKVRKVPLSITNAEISALVPEIFNDYFFGLSHHWYVRYPHMLCGRPHADTLRSMHYSSGEIIFIVSISREPLERRPVTPAPPGFVDAGFRLLTGQAELLGLKRRRLSVAMTVEAIRQLIPILFDEYVIDPQQIELCYPNHKYSKSNDETLSSMEYSPELRILIYVDDNVVQLRNTSAEECRRDPSAQWRKEGDDAGAVFLRNVYQHSIAMRMLRGAKRRKLRRTAALGVTFSRTLIDSSHKYFRISNKNLHLWDISGINGIADARIFELYYVHMAEFSYGRSGPNTAHIYRRWLIHCISSS